MSNFFGSPHFWVSKLSQLECACPPHPIIPALWSPPHSPSHHLKCCPGWREVLRVLVVAHMILNPIHPPPPSPPHTHLLSQGRHVKWEMGLGPITLPLGLPHSTYVSLGGPRRWALSDCLGEVISLCRTHEVLISVCMKRRGQISGKEDRSQRKAEGRGGGLTHWFPLFPLHTGECAGFGPLRFVTGCFRARKEVSLESLGIAIVNKFPLNLCLSDRQQLIFLKNSFLVLTTD